MPLVRPLNEDRLTTRTGHGKDTTVLAKSQTSTLCQIAASCEPSRQTAMPLAAFEHMADLEAQAPGEITFEGIHCTLSLQRPALGVILAVFKGPDVGEFGEAPFRELARDLEGGLPIEMFVDASQCLGPSIEVSHDWAQWMSKHRAQLHRVNILSGSRFVEMTASFVRRFTDFGERMRIYTDREAFYEALLAATGARK